MKPDEPTSSDELLDTSDGEPLRISQWQGTGMAIMGMLVGLLAVGGAISFLGHLGRPYAWVGAMSALVLLACSASFFRTAMSGIYLEQDGLKVKTRFHDHQLAWEEIEGFRLRPYPGPLTKIGMDVVLVDGKKIGAVGFSWRSRRGKDSAAAIVEALERRRLAYRA